MKIKFIDIDGNQQKWNTLDMATSELLQHELDHLDGVLSIDRAINSSKAKEQDIDVSQIDRNEFVKNERFLSKKTVKFDKNQQKINGFDQKN